MVAVGAVPVERFSTQAVEAVSSQKVQYGGSWGTAFSKCSVWRQLRQYLLKGSV